MAPAHQNHRSTPSEAAPNKIFGHAAGKITSMLKAKGGKLLAPPEAFWVTGREGPLADGEKERAKEWGKAIVEKMK